MSETTTTGHGIDAEDRTYTITVNDNPVILNEHRPTGMEIKQAAINAGVPIQPNWVLSEVKDNGKQKIVPDDKRVPIKDGDEFWVIPGDDNS